MGRALSFRGGRRRRRLPALLAAAGLAPLGLGAEPPAPELQWVAPAEDPRQASVQVSLPDGLTKSIEAGKESEHLTVRIATKTARPSQPVMAGTYSLTDGVLRFRPAFPLDPGQRYTATLKLGTGPSLRVDYVLPAPEARAATKVVKVTPSSDALPINLLKFYIHFSAPMSRGRAYEHIHLQDSEGGRVADPFLELQEELWDPEMKRLTVLLDPGRIKRGLLPNETVGSPLVAGRTYKLVVSTSFKDGGQQLLEKPFEKTFRAVEADYAQPDLSDWEYTVPNTGTREPLQITFPDSLDAALAVRLINVLKAAKTPLAGVASLSEQETVWRFQPDEPWGTNRHLLTIDHRIEDLAGNSIGRAFETVLDGSAPPRTAPAQVTRYPFTPQPANDGE